MLGMDPCWQNTPKELTIYILKLACSRVVYRDGKYIDIGTINCKSINCIKEYLDKKNSLKSDFQFVGNINRAWYLEFCFTKSLSDKTYKTLPHGLCFDYREHEPFEICYWANRIPLIGPGGRIRTKIN
jgi:hypothetical protein